MYPDDFAQPVSTDKFKGGKPPVDKSVEMNDPLFFPPPRGVTLLLINPGGVIIKGPWTDDCQCWMYCPGIPASVKQRRNDINVNKAPNATNTTPQQ